MAEETDTYEMIRILAFPEDMWKKMILDRFKIIAAQSEEQHTWNVPKRSIRSSWIIQRGLTNPIP